VDRTAKRADVPDGVCRPDTGAPHHAQNGYCTQIGNQHFTWFGTRPPKGRLNFLDLLRAGLTRCLANDAASDDRRGRALPAA
jgi:hypothetical protein